MQITLPIDLKTASRAAAAGFESVEAYVQHLIEEDAGSVDAEQYTPDRPSCDEWHKRFQELLAIVEPGNPHFDDSRQSIYPVR